MMMLFPAGPKIGGHKQHRQRTPLPKQATAVLKSWMFEVRISCEAAWLIGFSHCWVLAALHPPIPCGKRQAGPHACYRANERTRYTLVWASQMAPPLLVTLLLVWVWVQ